MNKKRERGRDILRFTFSLHVTAKCDRNTMVQSGFNSTFCCFRENTSVTRGTRCRTSPSSASSTDSSSETPRRKRLKKVRTSSLKNSESLKVPFDQLFPSSRKLYRTSASRSLHWTKRPPPLHMHVPCGPAVFTILLEAHLSCMVKYLHGIHRKSEVSQHVIRSPVI